MRISSYLKRNLTPPGPANGGIVRFFKMLHIPYMLRFFITSRLVRERNLLF